MTRTAGLAARLRAETAHAHHETEARAGIPGSIRTMVDYVSLLQDMLAFHDGVEATLRDHRWSSSWVDVGVDIDEHDRTEPLLQDLRELGAGAHPLRSGLPDWGSFAEALGCLYVVEGSSLGGRFIGPMIRQTLGPVPTGYYDGVGRQLPAPWRSLQAALAEYEAEHADLDDVVEGALATFAFFGRVNEERVALT